MVLAIRMAEPTGILIIRKINCIANWHYKWSDTFMKTRRILKQLDHKTREMPMFQLTFLRAKAGPAG